MTRRLEILKASLVKKEAKFDARLQEHMDTVRMANGQPLNDKRNGPATLRKWEKQNDALRTAKAEIERTGLAIEREEGKIAGVNALTLPNFISDAIASGEIVQWRKHPRFFFVSGVDKGRIVYDPDTGMIAHRYVRDVPADQYGRFREVFNRLNQLSKEK